MLKFVIFEKKMEKLKTILLLVFCGLLFGCNDFKVITYSLNEVTSVEDSIVYLKNDMTPINGKVISKFGDIGLFENGKNTGEIKIYFENGDLKVSKDYINDSTLRYKSWYENNQLHKQGNYQNNLKTGEWISWDKNGKPMMKGEFNNGKEIGIHFLFIENKLVSKTYYDNFGNNYKSIYYPLNSTSSYSLPYDSMINIYDEGKILKTRFYKYGKIESELEK